MLAQLVTLILPVFGMLLCPFACMGTESVMERCPVEVAVPCCGSQTAVSDCRNELPAGGEYPDHPHHNGCHHECVKNARVNTTSRTLLLKLDAVFLANAGVLAVSVSKPCVSITPGPQGRNPTHPEFTSGQAMCVTFGSLLL